MIIIDYSQYDGKYLSKCSKPPTSDIIRNQPMVDDDP
jgi:hypothetical protein